MSYQISSTAPITSMSMHGVNGLEAQVWIATEKDYCPIVLFLPLPVAEATVTAFTEAMAAHRSEATQ